MELAFALRFWTLPSPTMESARAAQVSSCGRSTSSSTGDPALSLTRYPVDYPDEYDVERFSTAEMILANTLGHAQGLARVGASLLALAHRSGRFWVRVYCGFLPLELVCLVDFWGEPELVALVWARRCRPLCRNAAPTTMSKTYSQVKTLRNSTCTRLPFES